MKNDAFVYFNDIPFTDLGGGVRRKVLAYSEDIMLVYLEFETGSIGSVHTHPHTQATLVLDGEFEFTIDGVKKTVAKGDALYDRPDVEHGCVCTKKGILLDVFTPMRKDFVGEA